MAANYSLFKDRGAIILAVATQSVGDASSTFVAVAKIGPSPTYSILADPDGRVAASYGIFNALIPNTDTPSTFIIASDRTIFWRYIGSSDPDRPPAAVTLSHLP